MSEDRQKLFGTDLMLVERTAGYDLIGNVAGDIVLAHGNDNIVQALTLRLRVRRGELAPLGWADYGSRLHELIGEPNNSRTHIRLMAYARDALERDARVKEILDIRTQVIPGERDTIRLYVDIQLIEEQNPLNLVVDLNLETL